MQHQRPLIFRQRRDAYAVLVSEFMLQQTTVPVVERYFPRFMQALPTLRDLADAPENAVIGLWAGLGYYRRARQLHAAAIAIRDNHHGEIPSDPAILEALPGIGRYTAGAIASQAFNRPAPILEANTVRVFARLAGFDGVVGEGRFMKQLWQVAEELVTSAGTPAIFNMAAMELGGVICRPVPACDVCPVAEWCRARMAGVAAAIPRIAPRAPVVAVDVICLILRNSKGKYFVRHIPAGNWHAGLWEFPTQRLAVPAKAGEVLEAARTFLAEFAIDQRADLVVLEPLKYSVTKHRVQLHPFFADVNISDSKPPAGMQILDLPQIWNLPMGSAQKKLLKVIMEMETARDD